MEKDADQCEEDMGSQSEDRDITPRNPINDLYRLADIKRWSVVRIDQKQSVAEHSFFVTLLAMRLANAIGAPVGRIVQYALLHDAEEAWTGDIPAPVKHTLESGSVPIEDMLGDMYVSNPAGITISVVKVCDLTESLKFLDRNGTSDHVKSVKESLRTRLDKYLTGCMDTYPHFNWDKGLEEIAFFLNNTDETFIDNYL